MFLAAPRFSTYYTARLQENSATVSPRQTCCRRTQPRLAARVVRIYCRPRFSHWKQQEPKTWPLYRRRSLTYLLIYLRLLLACAQHMTHDQSQRFIIIGLEKNYIQRSNRERGLHSATWTVQTQTYKRLCTVGTQGRRTWLKVLLVVRIL